MDDSETVLIYADSNELIPSKFGRGTNRVTMNIVCRENSTHLYFDFDDHHMASLQSYGNVKMRIDDYPAFNKRMKESTDNNSLGIWRGRGIPTIKKMFGAKELVIRATPYGESSITASFDISGLEEKITSLRKSCGW